MEKTFQLEIITPERQFFTGPVESLVLPALDGEYGVLPGHEPVVTAVEPGEARFKADGVWHEVIVTQGFAEITSEYAVLLVSTAEKPEEIDAARESLRIFVKELHDVEGASGIQIDTGGFMSFADMFFDNAFLDMYVQMQISEARQQVAAAIQQVEAVREALNGRL